MSRAKNVSMVMFAALASAAFGAHAMTLTEALRLAAERDPFLISANAAYSADAQLGEQERAGLRPSLGIEGQGMYNDTESQFAFGSEKDTFPSWSAYLQGRQPLLRMDWSARGDRADLRDAIAKDTLDDRMSQFVVRVSQRYLDTMLAEDGVRQAESESQAIARALDDTRKRYEVELVPGTDLKEAQARDDLAQAQLFSQRSALDDARDALQEVTGYDRSPLPLLREDLTIPPLSPPQVDEWVKLATENNPSRRIAQRQIELARTTLQSRKAEALPSADVVARAGRNDSTEYALGQRQDEMSIGVELTVPIYAGGYNRARVQEAEGRLREAEAEAERIALETERSVRTYFRAVETARAEVSAYSRALESATLAEKAVAAGYDAGTRTITDTLDAKSRVVNAARNRNASRLNLLTRLLQLYAASGTLTPQAVERADPLLFGTP
ncbi:MAG: hypothetical protein K0Q76_4094 [Panacagrimonas sp.]|jgi:TolC family type I secretion outer membrane protein|nr:TolC family outer membrane protein [Panacagrimonas sp.]MCC2658986.1 hypothetical protein [Panacagrimonas sp.]